MAAVEPVAMLVKPEWKIQPGEPVNAYERFHIYLNLGASRSLEAVAISVGMAGVNGSVSSSQVSSIHKQKKTWRWDERVAAYIDHKEELLMKSEIKECKRMNSRIIQNAMGLQEGWLKYVQNFFEKFNSQQINFDELKAKDWIYVLSQATKYYAMATDIERKARGEPTEILGHQGEISNKIQIEIKHTRYELEG